MTTKRDRGGRRRGKKTEGKKESWTTAERKNNGECYGWRDKGKSDFGAGCRFSHG